ncbi:hypothetical protein EV363DRAFT_1396592 [Boletus edulis]|uniref:DUF6533 domain-containing protein n=1 Tax=Boletus edulis BED1 TaxID=1328754 RepID=A0AAD4BY71_BOLED|nr:hypothetical protein EV363DRAFT_1396592 [Boletus edulis]KAF8442260.1 hypothetical protein L210DRAFT_497497 [Boletus edulis BED1]
MSDSSALQSALTTLLQYDYLTISILTAVGYDYILTFSNEVEYIWSKPWTWVSTLFIFLPTWTPQGICEILDILNEWAFLFFFGAADFVMILRVWAMYNRSRLVLGILLILFASEMISTVLALAIDSDPKKLPATTIQILNYSYCVLQATEPKWTNVAIILQITHAAVVCLLAILQVTRQSLQMYRVTKQWQPNRYMALLVKQGILSFFAVFLFNLINVLSVAGTAPTGGQTILLVILEYVPIYTLTPRFILSIREMYARDVRGRHEGIDTGFGLSFSNSEVATMAFAIGGQDEELDNIEIPIEDRGQQEQGDA